MDLIMKSKGMFFTFLITIYHKLYNIIKHFFYQFSSLSYIYFTASCFLCNVGYKQQNSFVYPGRLHLPTQHMSH